MQTQNIKKLHKIIQKNYRKNYRNSNSYQEDKILIRHWNVLYNQMKGNKLDVIEKTSNTILHNKLLEEISTILKYDNFRPYELGFISNDDRYKWVSYKSQILKLIKEEVENEK